MCQTKQSFDRRKHQRFITQKSTFAVLMPGFKNLGRVEDISRGGLAYRYVANGETNHDLYKMDIFLADKDFYLKDVPFITVSIFNQSRTYPFASIVMKQRCIRFGELDQKQKDQLSHFLLHHTQEKQPVKDRRQADASQHQGPDRRKSPAVP